MTSPSISSEVRARFLTLAADLDALDGHCREYEAIFSDRFVPEPDAQGDPAWSISDKARLLIMAVTCHARAVTWGLIGALNMDSPPAAYLLVRAHLEIGATAGYLLWKLRQHRSGALPIDDLHSTIVRLNMATRRHPDGTSPELVAQTTAINVTTLIEALDKLHDLQSGVQLKTIWEDLSEFCHPNAFSRFASGQRRVRREIHFDNRPTLKIESLTQVLVASLTSQEVFFFCRQESVRLIEELPGDR